MKKALAAIWMLLVFSGVADATPRITIIQSIVIRPYEEAVSGFLNDCSGTVERLVLSELPPDAVSDAIDAISSDIVLAVGLDALNVAKSIHHIPVIYCMVLPRDVSTIRQKNITGVLMQVPADVQLAKMLAVLPGVKSIGLIYNPVQSEKILSDAEAGALRLGIHLLAEPALTPREVTAALSKMRGRAGVVWMLPDITVSIPQAMELFTLFSFENKVPLVTYSEKSLEQGALMSIGVDAFDMGRQAGELANRMLTQPESTPLLPEEARTAIVTLNKTVVKKFGITANDPSADDNKDMDPMR